MGLLVNGSPMEWEEALDWLQHVRTNGIDQFLHIYDRVKGIEGDVLQWGDELEYGIFRLDKATKKATLSLRAAELLSQLEQKEAKHNQPGHEDGCQWVPEYGAWMIEGTPKVPYGGFTNDLRKVEANMRLRRARLLEVLAEDEIAPTITAFPLLGVGIFTDPPSSPNGPIALSQYVSDDVINPHPRFAALTRNIRKRRKRKIDIRVPLFRDIYTEARLIEEHHIWNAERSRPSYESKKADQQAEAAISSEIVSDRSTDIDKAASKAMDGKRVSCENPLPEPYPGFIHMDCMAFGMGMCCLQVTFQAKNIGESRHLYDHLGVLSPIMLALTAATPILKGRLADTDVRWATISAAVDDRTPQELGLTTAPTDPAVQAAYAKMAGNGCKRLPKSRYEGISTYICNHKSGLDPHSSTLKYNDVEVPYDEQSYQTLTDHGVDHLLSLHISHLFNRDPLVIYKQRLHLDNATETDHFENIQSTNWQTVRWKPPPPYTSQHHSAKIHVGWRTEFRSMEIQLTDFENAAYTVFVALLSRVILTFDLNLYIPLSKVNENMEAAHRINAVLNEKFYFRCHLAPPEEGDCASENVRCAFHEDPDRYELMTIAEIMMGKGSYFTGLIPIIYAYLDYIECDDVTRQTILKYLDLIIKRASGELPTIATWMRRFVRGHPEYKKDSVVSSSIAYDLLVNCQDIGEGVKHCPDLLGDFKIEPVRGQAKYQVPLKTDGVQASMRQKLLQRYVQRRTGSCECGNAYNNILHDIPNLTLGVFRAGLHNIGELLLMTSDVYLIRENIENDGIHYNNLMQEYQLDTYIEKMNTTQLPQTYHHLLRGVCGNNTNFVTASAKDVKSNLVGLLDGVPFDRPIQPLPENLLRAAFQLPAGSKPGMLVQRSKEKDGKNTGTVRSPTSQAATSDIKASSTSEKVKGKNEDKKEKKRRKREREDATMLQKILAPLILELRDVTWTKWIVHGKPSNPFIQKITRDNCKRLGVPTYFEYVKEPMDLTRMKEKVEKAEYHKIDQFSHDVQQLVKNATTFNRMGEPVHQMALELEQLYFSKLKTYRSTFEELQQERKKRKKEEKKKKKEKKKKGE